MNAIEKNIQSIEFIENMGIYAEIQVGITCTRVPRNIF